MMFRSSFSVTLSSRYDFGRYFGIVQSLPNGVLPFLRKLDLDRVGVGDTISNGDFQGHGRKSMLETLDVNFLIKIT